MPPRLTRHPQPAARIEADRARENVDHAGDDACKHHQREQIPAEQIQEGQVEDIEARVPAEHRIHVAERLGVSEQQPLLPLARSKQAEEHSQPRRNARAERLHAASIDGDRQRSLARVDDHLPGRDRAHRDPEVDEKDAEGHRHGRDTERALRGQRSGEDVLITHFPEPQPVRIKGDRRGQDDREEEDDGPEKNTPASLHEILTDTRHGLKGGNSSCVQLYETIALAYHRHG